MLRELNGARREQLRRVATFAVIGVAATLTHYVVALLSHTYLVASPLIANFCGYGSAVSVSYFGNAIFTYRRPVLDAAQAGRFMIISLGCLALSQSLTYVATTMLQLPFAVALLPVITIVPACSFVASSLWGFASKGEHGKGGHGGGLGRLRDRA